MSIDILSTSIRFQNAAGVTTFDSDRRNLLLPSFVSGSFPIERVITTNSGPRVFQRDFTLSSSVHPSARFVTGFWNTSANSNCRALGGDNVLGAGQEYMKADGSYITSVTGVWRLSMMLWFRVWCSGGVLRAHVFYRVPGGSDLGFNAFTVNYWAFCGTLDY